MEEPEMVDMSLIICTYQTPIQQLETTNRSLEVVTAQNKKQDDRLTALEKAPGVFGNKLWWAVIAAVIAGFVASELARYLH